MRFRLIAPFLMCGAALLAQLNAKTPTGDPAAQKNPEAEVLFQAAAHAEMVEGDLEKAIRLYREVVTKFAGDRAIAAQALVKLGACYQKIGRDEARSAYERVVLDYADQADAVRIARAKLLQLAGPGSAGGSTKAAGPTYHLVLDRFGTLGDVAFVPRNFDFAPDGSRFVFRKAVPEKQTTLLFIADAEGALVRPLLEDTGTWWGFDYPRWAPDGRRVAYLVHKAPYNVPGPWGIFVADAESGKTAQIGSDLPDSTPPNDLAWTSDGREITYVIPDAEGKPTAAREGIYSRSIATGETRLVQAMPVHWSLRLGGYSPDGRWLAFHQMAGTGDQRDIDVWLLPSGGGRAVKVTDGKGIDAQAAWAPDGRAVYFISDRSGDQNVWKVGVDPATGAALDAAQQVTFFTDGRVMHPRLFAGGRRVAITLSRNRTVIKAGHPAHPGEAREITRGRGPQLSTDGRTVYYIGEGPEQRGMFAIAIAGGTPLRLTSVPPHSGFDLSPDGRTLTYFTKDGNQIHLYTLSSAGGAPHLLLKWAATNATAAPISQPRWSPDGSQIAYAQDQTLFAIPAAGGQPRKVAQLYQWQEWLWAPDGKSIGALAYAAPKDIAVFVVPAEGGTPRRLTDAAEREYKEGLTWHPDGRRLSYMIYVGAGERDSALREAYVDGRPTSVLVREPDEWEYVGRWSADGRQFLYLSFAAQKSLLRAFDPATATSRLYTENVQIGVGGLAHGLMTWSADGTVVAWATISTTSQLWIAENFR